MYGELRAAGTDGKYNVYVKYQHYKYYNILANGHPGLRIQRTRATEINTYEYITQTDF
jgi:hypothetical protein